MIAASCGCLLLQAGSRCGCLVLCWVPPMLSCTSSGLCWLDGGTHHCDVCGQAGAEAAALCAGETVKAHTLQGGAVGCAVLLAGDAVFA